MANFSSWTETIVFTMAALLIITLVIMGSMDAQYGKNYGSQMSGGLADNSNSTSLFIQNNANLYNQTKSGTVGFNSLGISLTTSWTMILNLIDTIFAFLSGGFILNLINALDVGAAGTILATALITVWWAGILYFGIYLLFKVKA